MTQQQDSKSQLSALLAPAMLGWLVPGAGYFLINEKARGTVVFTVIVLTFLTGLYVGSIGVVDPVNSRPWFIAQAASSPFVFLLGRLTASGTYAVYGRPNEVGQIYTSIAGLMNLLTIVNVVYIGHLKKMGRW